MSDKTKTSRRGFIGGMSVTVASTSLFAQRARARMQNVPKTTNSPVNDVTVEKNIMVEMRDGTKLATDIYLPDYPGNSENSEGKPKEEFPTLVTRTPYNKDFSAATAEFFAQHKFAVVTQDIRGKFNSEGRFYPYRSEGYAEAKDSYDTVEWAADQTWSNGSVGTFGISYLAGTQWALVHNDELPPHLEAMAPGFAVSSYYGQGAYSGGACLLSHNLDYLNGFAVELFNREHPDREEEFTILDRAQEAMPQLHWDLPVNPFSPHEQADVDLPWLNEGWHAHETYDSYWEQQDHSLHYDKIDIPVLNYGGWYDIFCQGTVQNAQGLWENATGGAHGDAALVMGPYTHGDVDMQAQGQVMGHAYEFSENATYNEHNLLLDWFERHLKGKCSTTPRVRLYVPGLNEWIGASEFPLPETEFTKYYLQSNSAANVSTIDDENLDYGGRLTTDIPSADQPSDEYTYDPSDPVVTVGGYNTHWTGGVADRSTAYHDRDDILVYETGILEEDVAIVGPITVTLYAETSAVDTDFVVVLSDVDPLSRTGGLWVSEGARRGRIGDVEADPRAQETYVEKQLLESGEVYAWKIAVWPTARVFEAGHRIRIDISSSNFPRYDRNLNTGGGLDTEEMVQAKQTIYHDRDRPSHIELPIVPRRNLEKRVIDGAV